MTDTTTELINRIQTLESENKALLNAQRQMIDVCSQMLSDIESLKKGQTKTKNDIDSLRTFSVRNRWRIESLPYELSDPDFHLDYFKPKILSIDDTINQLSQTRKSIARFGDGEFAIIAERERCPYQTVTPQLVERLKEVLSCDDPSMMIGLNPSFYRNVFDMDDNDSEDGDIIRSYMRPKVRKQHYNLLSPDRLYANALFNSCPNENSVRSLQHIWQDKDCIIIEGVNTRSGYKNDLFANCRSIKRILCPASNAFEKYGKILEEAMKQSVEKLFLISLGPTATVLAYDLYLNGFQAIDTGHIDSFYEMYNRNLSAISDVKIEEKYCYIDSVYPGRTIGKATDQEYLSQIICTIE